MKSFLIPFNPWISYQYVSFTWYFGDLSQLYFCELKKGESCHTRSFWGFISGSSLKDYPWWGFGRPYVLPVIGQPFQDKWHSICSTIIPAGHNNFCLINFSFTISWMPPLYLLLIILLAQWTPVIFPLKINIILIRKNDTKSILFKNTVSYFTIL